MSAEVPSFAGGLGRTGTGALSVEVRTGTEVTIRTKGLDRTGTEVLANRTGPGLQALNRMTDFSTQTGLECRLALLTHDEIVS